MVAEAWGDVVVAADGCGDGQAAAGEDGFELTDFGDGVFLELDWVRAFRSAGDGVLGNGFFAEGFDLEDGGGLEADGVPAG